MLGTNAVDHSGFDAIEEQYIIPLPWYKLLSKTHLDGIFVDMQSIRYLPNVENVLSNSDQRFAFQKWMMEKISQAEEQQLMLNTMDHVADDKVHPTYKGHKLWANYILREIIK